MNNRKGKMILAISMMLVLIVSCFRPTEKDNSDTVVENRNVFPDRSSDFQEQVNSFWGTFSTDGLETIYGEWIPPNFNQYSIKNNKDLAEVKFYEYDTYSKGLQLTREYQYKDGLLQKKIDSITETNIIYYSYDELGRIAMVETEGQQASYKFRYEYLPQQNIFTRYIYEDNLLSSTTTIVKTSFGYEMKFKRAKTRFPNLYRYFYKDERLTKVEIDYFVQDPIIPSLIFEYKYLPSGMATRETVYLPDGGTIYSYKEQKEIDSTIEILVQDNNIYAPSERKIILSEIDESGNWHYGVEIHDGKIINTYKRDIIYTNDIVSEL